MGYMIPGRQTEYGYQPPMYYTGKGPVGGVRGMSHKEEEYREVKEKSRSSVMTIIEGMCPECGCNRLIESVYMPGFVDEYIVHCAACDHEIASSF